MAAAAVVLFWVNLKSDIAWEIYVMIISRTRRGRTKDPGSVMMEKDLTVVGRH